jgi:long-subunit fatty acid transport protein
VIHNAVVIAKALHRRLRLGLAIRATELHLLLHEQHYFDPGLWLQTNFNESNMRIGANHAEGLYRIYHLHKNDFKPSWGLGVVAELHPHLTAGVVYQYLPTFEIKNRITLPAYRLPDRTPADGRDDEIRFAPQETTIPFRLDLPDHFGAGLAWKPNAKTLLAADVALCRNHTLLRHLNQDLPQDDKPDGNGGYIDPDGAQDVQAQNLLSWRGGLEYTMFKWKFNFPLRFGFYTEPNFGLQAVSGGANLKREYPAESAYFHFTAGIGLVLKKVRFETSLDLSSTHIEAIGSAVVNF